MNWHLHARKNGFAIAAFAVLAPAPQGPPPPAAAARPAFEVASMKPAAPGRRSRATLNGILTVRSESLHNLIVLAYGVGHFQVSGPAWINEVHYDILAKAATAAPEAELKFMLQTLLAERLHLALHHETREPQVIAMTVGKNGPRLQPSESDAPLEMRNEKGAAMLLQATMRDLAALLSVAGSSTYDMTGIQGRYRIVLDFRQYLDPSDSTMAALGNALREAAEAQLGLRFANRRLPIDVLAVDRAERVPLEN